MFRERSWRGGRAARQLLVQRELDAGAALGPAELERAAASAPCSARGAVVLAGQGAGEHLHEDCAAVLRHAV